uniref:Uncharacterized protein n=1 Tax=Cannabis sativa TaxID=3483 RepID=A0A803Q0K1_CANSA
MVNSLGKKLCPNFPFHLFFNKCEHFIFSRINESRGSLSQKGKEEVDNLEAPADVKVEFPKRPKKNTANKKRASQTTNLEVPEIETQDLTPPAAPARTDENIPKKTQASASLSQDLETLLVEVGKIGPEYTAEFGAACWRHFKALLPHECDLINNGDLEEMLTRSIGKHSLLKEIEKVKKTHNAELEATKKEAKDKVDACQKLQGELDAAKVTLEGKEAETIE